MKRNFDEPILDLDGEPVRAGASPEAVAKAVQSVWPTLTPEVQKALGDALDREAGKPLTLGSACVGALMGMYEGEQNMDDAARMTRMELARRVHKGGVQEITPTDRDLIKPLLKRRYAGSILIPVIAAELLEKEATDTRQKRARSSGVAT